MPSEGASRVHRALTLMLVFHCRATEKLNRSGKNAEQPCKSRKRQKSADCTSVQQLVQRDVERLLGTCSSPRQSSACATRFCDTLRVDPPPLPTLTNYACSQKVSTLDFDSLANFVCFRRTHWSRSQDYKLSKLKRNLRSESRKLCCLIAPDLRQLHDYYFHAYACAYAARKEILQLWNHCQSARVGVCTRPISLQT